MKQIDNIWTLNGVDEVHGLVVISAGRVCGGPRSQEADTDRAQFYYNHQIFIRADKLSLKVSICSRGDFQTFRMAACNPDGGIFF